VTRSMIIAKDLAANRTSGLYNMPTQWTGDEASGASAAATSTSFKTSAEEMELLAALRRGDELTFSRLVVAHHSSLLRTARLYVNTPEIAEEVVQETWLGVLKGLDKFEGRCSLKTWIFQILINRARTRGEREGRMIPFSTMFDAKSDPGEPAVDSSQFNENDPEWPGGWVTQPRDWGKTPEQTLLSQELRAVVQSAIETLPPNQKEVITLRDVQGWTSKEVCNILGVSETNQRVLLHRSRSKVRQVLDQYFVAR
jgi:RNA polymerase sigma-70 factor (ECF subfamily)